MNYGQEKSKRLIAEIITHLKDGDFEDGDALTAKAEDLSESIDYMADMLDEYNDKVSELEADKEDFEREAEEAAEIKALAEELKSCYERLNLGVISEIDRIIEITNELIERYY